MTFTNEQKKSTLMSLNLNEITNLFFTLSSIIDKKIAIKISSTNRRNLTNASSAWYKSIRRRKKSMFLLCFDTNSNRRRVWKNLSTNRHQAIIKAI
jgi:hypothetical protein